MNNPVVFDRPCPDCCEAIELAVVEGCLICRSCGTPYDPQRLREEIDEEQYNEEE